MFANFVILERKGYRIEDSPVTDFLAFKIANIPPADESSTNVRNANVPHEHEYLTSEISNYIKQHNLYAQQN